MNRRLFLATAVGLALASLTALAQTTPPTRVRGTIAGLDGDILTVDSRDGQKFEILLSDTVTVATVKTVALESIGPGTYVGTATRADPDGKPRAIEVLVFPDAMRGSSEGHFPWDLEPGSMMTNGTVKAATPSPLGRELSIAFKDSANTVIVPPNVPVVTFAPAERADLKPGAKLFLVATRNAEGKLTAARVTVAKDGVAPPM